MDKLEKLKIYKANSLYADFLFSYPATYIFQHKLQTQKIDISSYIQESTHKNILYIHIPFCYHICSFCNVYKEKVDFSILDSYLNILLEEIGEISKSVSKIEGLYIAGGTPTLLSESQLDQLFSRIYDVFEISKDVYIEIDAFPSTLTPKKLNLLHQYKVNQLSIGIQSMDPEVLDHIGRKGQSYREVNRLAEDLKQYNFNLHFDFIVGLPGENITMLKNDIEYIAQNFNPFSISINSYDNTSDTLLFSREKDYFKTKKYKTDLRENVDMLEVLLLKKYNISRKKTPYFQSFWEKHYNVIAVGAGAFGFIQGFGVYRNSIASEYIEKKFAYKKVIPFIDKDYKIMFLIHNYEQENIDELYFSLFGNKISDDFSGELKKLSEKGYVEFGQDKKIVFSFDDRSIAYFYFIDFYSENIIQYYNTRHA